VRVSVAGLRISVAVAPVGHGWMVRPVVTTRVMSTWRVQCPTRLSGPVSVWVLSSPGLHISTRTSLRTVPLAAGVIALTTADVIGNVATRSPTTGSGPLNADP
jgi:hypothetical protein